MIVYPANARLYPVGPTRKRMRWWADVDAADGDIPGYVGADDLIEWKSLATRLGTSDGQVPQLVGSTWGGVLPWINQCTGRLTLVSGNAVPTTDQPGKSTVYFTSIANDGTTTGASFLIWLYDGTRWKAYENAEVSLALSGLVPYQAYDVYLYDNSGTLTLETSEWGNSAVTCTSASPMVVTWTGHGLSTGNSVTFTASAMPTGVSANTQYFVTKVDANSFKISTTLANVAASSFVNSTSTGTSVVAHSPTNYANRTTQDGILVKSGATTRRLVGAILMSAANTTEDVGGGASSQHGAKRFIWNLYNRRPRPFGVYDGTASWPPASTGYEQLNSTDANRCQVFHGLLADPVVVSLVMTAQCSTGSAIIHPGIGLDSTNTFIQGGFVTGSVQVANVQSSLLATWSSQSFPGLGYHNIVPLENTDRANCTIFGVSAQDNRTGLAGVMWA